MPGDDAPTGTATERAEAPATLVAARAASLSLVFAVSLTVMKLIAVIATGSIALLASAVDSFSDVAATGVIWLNLQSSQPLSGPGSRSHSARGEAVSAMIQAAFVAGAGLVTLSIAVRRSIFPIDLHHAYSGLVVMLVSIVATLALMLYQRRTLALGIAAERLHYESDLLTNVAVVLALIGAGIYGLNRLDPLIGAVVSSYLLLMSFRTGRDAARTLLERALPADLQRRIEEAALATAGVLAFDGLRTRDVGGERFVEFHIELQPDTTVQEANRIVLQLEADLEALLPSTEVSIYPLPGTSSLDG